MTSEPSVGRAPRARAGEDGAERRGDRASQSGRPRRGEEARPLRREGVTEGSAGARRGSPVSLVAFGDPMDGRTFSGISLAIGRALQDGDRLKQAHAIRDLRPWDALRGAVQMKWGGGRPRLGLRREWLWRRSGGNALLEERLRRRLERSGDTGPFLQIGSLVRIPEALGRHYVFTDMTVPQAANHRQFAIGRADGEVIREATEVQAEVFANAAHIFVAADWTRRSVMRDFGVAPDRVTTVYVGSNLESARPRRQVSSRRRRIMFIGIDWERKGGPLMAEAFRLVRQRVPDAELAIVGCSPDVDVPGVEVVGYLSPHRPENRERIAGLMDESRCLCLVSHFDPMPNAIIEAYSFGLPVIALKTGSREEVVEDGRSGLLCADERPETVADAMERLLTDDQLLEKTGARARQLHLERFNWRAVVGRICRVIDAPARRGRLGGDFGEDGAAAAVRVDQPAAGRIEATAGRERTLR